MTTIDPTPAAATAPHQRVDDLARRVVQRFTDDSRIPGMSLAVASPDRQLFAVAAAQMELSDGELDKIIDSIV